MITSILLALIIVYPRKKKNVENLETKVPVSTEEEGQDNALNNETIEVINCCSDRESHEELLPSHEDTSVTQSHEDTVTISHEDTVTQSHEDTVTQSHEDIEGRTANLADTAQSSIESETTSVNSTRSTKTVKQLKQELTKVGIKYKTTAKKADLVNLLNEKVGLLA
jgi:hypothetical protein